ncbi:membrane protein of ER body-like protein [Salvia hispanica]|uniref:membrane protein of ER body-like protein n=1 Tax=Salvia hispanica TaxID=49212 RepID=UPI00200934FC|nr:membrane protein of ER body-like protein [Salvia hispanica]
MEVVHDHVEEEEVVTVEEKLLPRRRGPDFADPIDDGYDESSDDTVNSGSEVLQNVVSDENSVYFDDKKGIWKCHDCIWTYKIGQSWVYHLHQKPFNQGGLIDFLIIQLQHSEIDSHHEEISKIVHSVINRQHIVNFNAEIVTVPARESVIVEESDDEEVIELEFERAVDKVHTHTPYCPNCSNQITKVILRRKKKASPRPDKPLDLLGCLSCFSIFIPSGDCLNPFRLFKSKPKLESHNIEEGQPPISVGGTTADAGESKQSLKSPSIAVGSTPTNAAGTGYRLNPFYYFGYNSKPKLQSPKIEFEQPSNDIDGSTTTNAPGILGEAKPEHNPRDVSIDIKDGPELVGGRPALQQPLIFEAVGGPPPLQKPLIFEAVGGRPPLQQPLISEAVGGRPPLQQPLIPEMVGGRPALQQPLIYGDRRSRSLEFWKCIVYGGLLESIASLSIVSSTAASDATTLNVVVIGLATLLSGLMAFGCNLVEALSFSLDVCHSFLHHFWARGPVTYGFAFHDSDDKDYKMLAVAAAGFGCIFVLAIAKAYVKGVDRFGGYVKTIMYYVTMAVSASGVAYAAGDLIGKLLDDLGWFQPAQVVASQVSSLAAY